MTSSVELSRRIVRIEVPEDPDYQWEWATSLPYRCLADTQRARVMPAAPDERQVFNARNFNQRLAYYTCLQSFLTYSFAWTRHDKGLDWWRKQDFAPLDDRLALIRSIWHDDGTLTGFFAWATTVNPEIAVAPLARWARHPDLRPLQLDSAARQVVARSLEQPPWNGGSDPMHLGGGDHGGAPSAADFHSDAERGELIRMRLTDLDVDSRRALFVADGIFGWYSGLCHLGAELPKLPGSRSWRVDVYVREVGFVGTYRRSRDTGLWFAGKHALHVAGN